MSQTGSLASRSLTPTRSSPWPAVVGQLRCSHAPVSGAGDRRPDGATGTARCGIPPIRSRRGPRRRRPGKLHGDTAYDHRHLRRWLASRGIRHRLARKGIESSRRLGQHRWVVERTVSWLSGCRRLHRCYERKPEHSLAGGRTGWRGAVQGGRVRQPHGPGHDLRERRPHLSAAPRAQRHPPRVDGDQGPKPVPLGLCAVELSTDYCPAPCRSRDGGCTSLAGSGLGLARRRRSRASSPPCLPN